MGVPSPHGAQDALEAMRGADPIAMDEENATKEILVKPHETPTFTDELLEEAKSKTKKTKSKASKEAKKGKKKKGSSDSNGLPATPPCTPATSVTHKTVSPLKRLAREQQESVDRLSKPLSRLSTKTVYAHRYHKTAQTVPIAVTPVISTLQDLYRKIFDSVSPPLLNPVQHVYTEEGDRIDNVLDLYDGQHLYYVCAGDFIPSKQPKTKKARTAALEHEREIISRVSSPLHKPVRKIILKRKYRKDMEQSMKMQGIRDPYESMEVVILNKYSTVDELIFSINKTSPVQVVAIYDRLGHKKESLDDFEDGESAWMQIRGDPPVSPIVMKKKVKKTKETAPVKVKAPSKKAKKAAASLEEAVALPEIVGAPDAGEYPEQEEEQSPLLKEAEISEQPEPAEETSEEDAEDLLDEGVSPVHIVWDRVDSKQPVPVALHLDATDMVLQESPLGSLKEEEGQEVAVSEDKLGMEECDEEKKEEGALPMDQIAVVAAVGVAAGAAAGLAGAQPGASPGLGEGGLVPTDMPSEAAAMAEITDLTGSYENVEAMQTLDASSKDVAASEAEQVLPTAEQPGVEKSLSSVSTNGQGAHEELPAPAEYGGPADAEATDASLISGEQVPEKVEPSGEPGGLVASGAIPVAASGIAAAAAEGISSEELEEAPPNGDELETAGALVAEPETPTSVVAEEEVFFTPAAKLSDESKEASALQAEEDNLIEEKKETAKESSEQHEDMPIPSSEGDEILPEATEELSGAAAEAETVTATSEKVVAEASTKAKKGKKKSKEKEKKEKKSFFSCGCFGGGKK